MATGVAGGMKLAKQAPTASSKALIIAEGSSVIIPNNFFDNISKNFGKYFANNLLYSLSSFEILFNKVVIMF